MLNEETRAVLKNLIPINNSMIIAPTMTGCDEFKNILFKVDLSKIDPDITEFGIFDVSVFLQAMDLLEKPQITFNAEEKRIVASDENTEIEYITSGVSFLDYVQVPVKNIDTTVSANSVVEFSLDSTVLQKIKKVQAVFKNFDTLQINSKENNVQISIGNENTFSKNNNSWKLDIKPDLFNGANSEFQIAIPLESIMKLPLMSYDVRVKYNEKRDAYRIIIDNSLMTFLLSVK